MKTKAPKGMPTDFIEISFNPREKAIMIDKETDSFMKNVVDCLKKDQKAQIQLLEKEELHDIQPRSPISCFDLTDDSETNPLVFNGCVKECLAVFFVLFRR